MTITLVFSGIPLYSQRIWEFSGGVGDNMFVIIEFIWKSVRAGEGAVLG
jgi:hypothetical protein